MSTTQHRSTDDAKPKRVALLGATGAYGGGVLRRALATGVHVVAVVRNPDKLQLPPGAEGVTVVRAELDDVDTLVEAFQGVDGVISALSMGVKAKRGAFSPKSKNPNIYRAMKAAGVRKFIAINGASCPVPGEWGHPKAWFHYGVSHLFLPADLIAENRVEIEELFGGTNGSDELDWVIVRATRVDTEREYSGVGVSLSGVVSIVVGAEDVGEFCLFAAASSEYNGKAPYVGTVA